MGKTWNKLKQINAAIENVVDAVVPGGASAEPLRVDDGTCQEKGRLSGNRKCGKPLKRGHETCGHRICAQAWQAEHDIVPNPAKKPLLKQDPNRLKARRDTLPKGHDKRSGAIETHRTVMCKQMKIKGVWTDVFWDPEKKAWVTGKEDE